MRVRQWFDQENEWREIVGRSVAGLFALFRAHLERGWKGMPLQIYDEKSFVIYLYRPKKRESLPLRFRGFAFLG